MRDDVLTNVMAMLHIEESPETGNVSAWWLSFLFMELTLPQLHKEWQYRHRMVIWQSALPEVLQKHSWTQQWVHTSSLARMQKCWCSNILFSWFRNWLAAQGPSSVRLLLSSRSWRVLSHMLRGCILLFDSSCTNYCLWLLCRRYIRARECLALWKSKLIKSEHTVIESAVG